MRLTAMDAELPQVGLQARARQLRTQLGCDEMACGRGRSAPLKDNALGRQWRAWPGARPFGLEAARGGDGRPRAVKLWAVIPSIPKLHAPEPCAPSLPL